MKIVQEMGCAHWGAGRQVPLCTSCVDARELFMKGLRIASRGGTLLAIYKCIVDRIKEQSELERKPQDEAPIGFKSTSSKFTAPRAKSSQATLLKRADDWQMQFDVDNEGSQGRNDCSPQRLLSSLERALVLVVPSGP